MSDIIDDANATADLFLASALSIRQRAAKVPASGVGMCLCCSADLPDDRRWCDSECRDLWENQTRARQ